MRSPHARRSWRRRSSTRHGDRQRPASPLRWSDRLIEAGALFLLVFTPLAYGTVEPWSEAIAELVVLGMVVVWIVGMLGDWELRVELPPGWLPASLFLALVFFQATPLPHALIGLVSPWTTGFYDAALTYTGASMAAMPLSLAPHATLREAWKLGAVAAFFLVCYNVYRTRAQVQRALWTMIVTGTLISIFGIVQRVTWNGRFYWIGPEAPHPSAFGPFVNRAHFAGLMVIIVPMALALWLGSRRTPTRRRLIRTWRDRLRVWNSSEAGPVNLVPILALVMGGAALVSGSRGGLVALVGALIAMVVFSARRGTGVTMAAAALLVVLAGIWIGSDIVFGTVERLAEEVQGAPESPRRLDFWRDAMGLVRQTPLFGVGLSGFGLAYPLVRTVRTPVTYTHAESDWVQLLTDTGLIGTILGVAALTALGAMLLRRSETPGATTSWLRLAGAAALAGAVLGGIGNYTMPVMAGLLYLLIATLLSAPGRRQALSAEPS